jgi:hypothetical protein
MDEHEYYQKFEARGEQGVRDDLAAGRYNPRHAALAQEWLRSKERARSDALNAEMAATASRAATAAERAATAAERANRIAERALAIAKISATIAIIGIVIAIVALFRH